MNQKQQHIDLLSNSMEELIMQMKAVDDRCLDIQKDITPRELNIISFLDKQGKAKMSEIADFIDVPMSTATGVVDKLVAKKYLQRRHSATDRRIVQIELNILGVETAELFNSLKEELAERILTLLSEKEVKVFLSLLEKISDGMSAMAEVK